MQWDSSSLLARAKPWLEVGCAQLPATHQQPNPGGRKRGKTQLIHQPQEAGERQPRTVLLRAWLWGFGIKQQLPGSLPRPKLGCVWWFWGNHCGVGVSSVLYRGEGFLLWVFFWNLGLLPSPSLTLLACRDVDGVEGLGVGSRVFVSSAGRELGSRRTEAADPLR